MGKIIKKFDGDEKIQYSHILNRYEIEFPIEYVKGEKKPPEFEFSSAKLGFQRFTTRYTREVVDRLEIAEDRLKEIMCPFLTAIFSKFHDHKIMWLQILNILTELDCLCSLSIASGH